MQNSVKSAPVAVAASEVLQLVDTNPCLDLIPELRSMDDALTIMECIPDECPLEWAVTDADLQIPTFERARLAYDLVAAVRESAAERDLSSPEFRSKTISAAELINHLTNRHGHTLPAASITVTNAAPRGFFVIVPAGTGQRALRRAIERCFGTEPKSIDLRLPDGGSIRFARLPTLCIPFPANGSLRSFAKAFVARFDGAMQTRFSERARGPLHRGEQDINAAIQAFAIAANLGLLIVEQINTRDAQGGPAAVLWDTLSQFTSATGIPVLCLATPGAAAALSEQSGAISALASTSAYHIPPVEPDSDLWLTLAAYLYERHLSSLLSAEAPEWFSLCLWRATLGHTELAAKVCTHVASVLGKAGTVELSEKAFLKHADDALILERPHLNAVERLQRGGRFTATSIRRHGDWLPLRAVMRSVPGLDEQDSRKKIADVQVAGGA